MKSKDIMDQFEDYVSSKQLDVSDWKADLKDAILKLDGARYKESINFGTKEDGKRDISSGYEGMELK